LRMVRFVLQPATDQSGEAELREAASHGGRQALFQRGTVDAARLLGPNLGKRTALHEVALHRVKRCELQVARPQRVELAFDAEQFGEKVLEVRGDGDQQLRLRQRAERVEHSTGAEQALSQIGCAVTNVFDEVGVDREQTFAPIQIFELQAVR